MTELPRSEYVSLTTYRRSGDPVPTPVWAAPFGPSAGARHERRAVLRIRPAGS